MKINNQNKYNKFNKFKGFTLAEALIVLAIITTITIIVINSLSKGDVKSKILLSSYQKTYADLQQIAQSTANSSRKSDFALSSGGFDFLSCDDTNDTTQCLKETFLNNSNAQDCSDNNCIANFSSQILPATQSIHQIFSGLTKDDFKMMRLPSGAVVAMKYFDKTCSLRMPIYVKDGNVQTISNSCGLLIADINGANAPNNYAQNGKDSDIYFFALQKDGIKGSEQAIAEAVGCKYPDQQPDFAKGGCVAAVRCPDGAEIATAGESGAFKYKDMWGNYGYCKKSAKACANVGVTSCPNGTLVLGCPNTCSCSEGTTWDESTKSCINLPDCAIPPQTSCQFPNAEGASEIRTATGINCKPKNYTYTTCNPPAYPLPTCPKKYQIFYMGGRVSNCITYDNPMYNSTTFDPVSVTTLFDGFKAANPNYKMGYFTYGSCPNTLDYQSVNNAAAATSPVPSCNATDLECTAQYLCGLKKQGNVWVRY